MVKRQYKMNNFDQTITEISVMKLTSRHRNGRHSSRPEKDLIFAPPHFLKGTKNKLPTLNFSSRFLPYPAFSTFAAYNFLCVEKFTHKKLLATPPAAKELKLTHKAKTRAKKFCLPTWASLTILCISTLLFSVDSFAQQPVGGNLYDRYKNWGEEYIIHQQGQVFTPTPTPFGLLENYHITNLRKMLNTPTYQNNDNNSEAIIKQRNQQAMQAMGYKSPEEQKAELERQKFEAFYISTRERKRMEVYELISEADQDAKAIQAKQKAIPPIDPQFLLVDSTSVNYKVNSDKYFYGYNEMMKMLAGAKALSIKEAVWLVEGAYSGNKLLYQEYTKLIDEKVKLVKYIMQKEELGNSNLARNYAIQQLFSDTIIEYGANGKPIKTHYPMVYDFDDFMGDKDWTKMFVTKLLKTGTGQCHSMPLLYLIIAEALEAEAFLSFSPSHSYIMAKDNNGRLYNFETTNGRLTTRDWIMGSNYLKIEAIQNRIYLHPNGKEQVIAQCLLDLASGYQREFGYDWFILECAESCRKYSPNSLQAIMHIANLGTAYCRNEAHKYAYPPLDELDKYPKLKELFEEMVTLHTEIDVTGYEEMPKDAYEQWLRSVDDEKNKREHQDKTNELRKQCGK